MCFILEFPVEIWNRDETKATYDTSDGDIYEFSLEKQADGNIRVYILSQPVYRDRDTSLHMTHREYDGQRYYIDWAGPLYSLEDAKQVAREWVRRTDEYIAGGKPFAS